MANELLEKDTELTEEALEAVSGGREMYPEEKERFDKLVENFDRHMRSRNDKKGMSRVADFDRMVDKYKRRICSLRDGSDPVMFDDFLREYGFDELIFRS